MGLYLTGLYGQNRGVSGGKFRVFDVVVRQG